MVQQYSTPTSKSNGENKKCRKSELKSKRGDTQQRPDSFYSESFLIGPDLGTVGEGSALRVQRGAVSSSGLSLAGPIWAIRVFSAEEAW